MEIPHLASQIKIHTIQKVETEHELSKTSMNFPMCSYVFLCIPMYSHVFLYIPIYSYVFRGEYCKRGNFGVEEYLANIVI